MIKVVTFDLDDTLWENEGVIRRAEAAMRGWLVERVPGFREWLDTDAMAAVRQAVARQWPELRHDVTKLRLEVLRRALLACGMDGAEATRQAGRAFAVFAEARHQVTYFDGALATLKVLAARYRLASLTNGNASYQRLGLDRYFSFGLTAADVGASKPHPAMFEAALRQAGVPPWAAAHVGDSPDDDVRGARAVGMRAIWANHRGSGERVDAHAVITALPELPEVLRRLA